MQNNQPMDFSKFSEILSSGDDSTRKKTAEKMMSGLNREENRELKEIMNDKEKINLILNSPAVKQILEKLRNNKNG